MSSSFLRDLAADPYALPLLDALGVPVVLLHQGVVLWASAAVLADGGSCVGRSFSECEGSAPGRLQAVRRTPLELLGHKVEVCLLGDPATTPERVSRERRELMTREAVSRTLREARDEAELYEGVLVALTGLAGLEVSPSAGLFVVEPGARRLRLVHHRGDFPIDHYLARGGRLEFGRCLCGRAAECGDVLVSADCFTDPRHEAVPGMTAHGHCVIPLKAADEVVGVVVLYTEPEPEAGPERRALLEWIGAAVGQALVRVQAEARLRARADELAHLATRDDLTGVWNRREADRRLTEGVQRAAMEGVPFSIALLDIDHFKEINDTHGHAAGDRVLLALAARLQAACRAGDTIGRWGGEEFLLVLPATDAVRARSIAERTRRALADAPLEIDGRSLRVTASLGVATSSAERPTSADELLLAADRALYEAKDGGRNLVVVAPPAP